MKTFGNLAFVVGIQLVLTSMSYAEERFIVATGSISRQVSPEARIAIKVSARSGNENGGAFGELEAKRDERLDKIKDYLMEHYGESGWKVRTRSTGVSTGPNGAAASAEVICIIHGQYYPKGLLNYATRREGVEILWISSRCSEEEESNALQEALDNARYKAEVMARSAQSSLGKVLEITEVSADPVSQSQDKGNGNSAQSDFVTIYAKVQAKFELVEDKGQDGPANGSQPIRAETNRTSSAAGSRR